MSRAAAAAPQLSQIVAMAANGVIGAAGALPWHLPEDLRLFKRLTMGHALIMGRKTYESIGRPLPGRLSIVVTRQPRFAAAAGVVVTASVVEAVAAARAQAPSWGDEVFVIGGGELYRETLPLTRRIYRTTVHGEFTGDTRFPELPPGEFQVVRTEPGAGALPFTWDVLERVTPPHPR